MTKTPASFDQLAKALVQLGEPSSGKLQWLLGSGLLVDLGRNIGPHLADVDREAFRALIALKPFAWNSSYQYADKIRGWNDRFGLGLSEKQIDNLAYMMPDHIGPDQPTSISMALGQGLQYDYEVGLKVLHYEFGNAGMRLTLDVSPSQVLAFPGSEVQETGRPQLGITRLDLGKFVGSLRTGFHKEQVREQFRGQPLPGLEVLWLLALNPHAFRYLDGHKMPFLFAPGLTVGDQMLCFGCDAEEAYVSPGCRGYSWARESVAMFPEF